MRIENHDLTKEVFVVAEIGNNHEGDFALAQKMIGLAAHSGVHAVKFQTIRADLFCSKKNEQRYNTLKKFEFSDAQFATLAQTAKDEGVLFMSTPFDLEGVTMLNDLVPVFKIASGDLTFYPLIEAIAQTGKPVILSTGMSTVAEIHCSKKCIEQTWEKNKSEGSLALLHCVVSYPTPSKEANLAAIKSLSKEFSCTIGYSDHTLGIDAAVLSVALGARIIEKHFTSDKNQSAFRDHQLSANPEEMKTLVEKVKLASELLGSGEKIPQETEQANLIPVRRSIVTRHALPAGHLLSENDIVWMRPADGIAPGQEKLVLGKKLNTALDAGDQIRLEHLIGL